MLLAIGTLLMLVALMMAPLLTPGACVAAAGLVCLKR